MQQGIADLLNAGQNAAAQVSGPAGHGLRLFGVTLIGATTENGHKFVLTIAFIAIAPAITWASRQILKLFIGTRKGPRFQGPDRPRHCPRR